MITTSLKYKMEIAQKVISGQKTLQQARELFRDDLGEFLNIYGTMKEVSDRMKELDQFANNQRFATITAYKMLGDQYNAVFDKASKMGNLYNRVKENLHYYNDITDDEELKQEMKKIEEQEKDSTKIQLQSIGGDDTALGKLVSLIIVKVAEYKATDANIEGFSRSIVQKRMESLQDQIKKVVGMTNSSVFANVSFADICKKEALKQFLTENGFGGIYEQ